MKNKLFIRFNLLCCLFLFLLSTSASGQKSKIANAILPQQLLCERMLNPQGIDAVTPRLSWISTATERAQVQTAYRIIVASSLKKLNANTGDIWDSKKIESSESLNVIYNGKPLTSTMACYWKVRVWDKKGIESPWSQPAQWTMGLLNDSDWQAKWIGDESSQFTNNEDFYKEDPMPLFRKSFNVNNKKISSARLYVSGLGYYETYLNGKKVGDHMLDPGWTNYQKQVLYSTYDITKQIQHGANVIGVMVGNGWYNLLPLRMWGQRNLREILTIGRPCTKAQIRISYTDGSFDLITTDNTWQTLSGPIVRNSIYLGEHYDARLEQQGWMVPNTKLIGFKNAKEIKGPSGKLVAQLQPPIKIIKVLKPVSVSEVKPCVYVFDMGQNFAGVARIKVRGSAGTHITLRYGEDIYKDGNINVMTSVAGQIKNGDGGPGAPPIAWQTDSYILKGKGVETWSPRFTFHGFRYVEVTGWPGKPTLSSIEGLCLSADVETVGSFTSSNLMLNKLNELVQWTFRSNLFSVQSDCPAREKFGYGGDMFCSSEAFMYNFNMSNFYRKVVEDYINDQRPQGGMTETAPYVGIADLGPGDGSGPLGFQLGFPYVLKQLYDFYGDKRIIEESYEPYIRQVIFLIKNAKNYLYDIDISDHESLDKKPTALTASAFFYHHIKLAAEFAAILDKKEDAKTYDALAGKIKDAINRKFLVSETGKYDNATQSAQAFALWYDLAPEKRKEVVIERLLEDIKSHNGHLSTGIFGTKMMFDVLRKNNLNEIAYSIANQRDFPGWGYMIENGATTLWETWAYSDNTYSKNHPMFGSVNEWFYRSLLGINAGSPGFKKIIIKPQPVSGLLFAKGSYNSAYGLITSDWRIDKDKFRLNIIIPVNTVAEIWIPIKNAKNISEGGKPIQQVSDVEFLRIEDGYSVFATGSGSYLFEAGLSQ